MTALSGDLPRVATLDLAHAGLALVAAGWDRAAHRRDDAAWQREAVQSRRARAVVIARDQPLLIETADGHAASMPLAEAFALAGERPEAVVFLGLVAEAPTFAVGAERGEAPAGYARVDMRTVMAKGLVPPDEAGLLATAKAILAWHGRRRFCSACGSESVIASAGWKRRCPACGLEHFPRTDPVVIMTVVDGDDLLLGRAPRFPETMFSCLAGFVEPGETIEQAVRREVLEEAGIVTGRVGYLASQPWPFPSSLMIGCVAEALSRTITLDDELADARWFSRGEVAAMLEGRHPAGLTVPPPMAIAHQLLRLAVTGAGALPGGP